jgi:serine/threonine protein kinase
MDDTGIYEAGTIIDGRYRIEARLGRGGFATVYRARHLKLDRPAALKVLEPIAPFISDRFYARFETEARIAANLDHPNVVRIFDYGMIEPDNRPYIAMQMLEGRDLEAHLDLHGALEPTHAKKLFEGVIDALRLGHERGIVHKDLKPSNLFVVAPDTPREKLVVLDYGIAWLEGDENPRYTEEGQYTGTPAYMPPEYIQNREVSPAFDVYQLGLIFIETLTGQPVVSAGSNLEFMVAHIEGKHRVPDGFGDSPMGATLLKAISVDPADRYQNAGEMLDAVQIAKFDASADFTLPAITVEEQKRGAGPQPGRDPRSQDVQPAREAPPEKKSNVALWVGFAIFGFLFLAGLLAIVAGGLAWYAMSDDGSSGVAETTSRSPIEPPSIPSVKLPGSVAGATEIYGLVLARYMVHATLNQVKLFQDSVKRANGNPKHIFAPTGTSQMLDVAHQQIDNAGDEAGAKVQKKARRMQAALRELEVVLTDLHDYYSVKKGYRTDDGEKGRDLQKRLRRTVGKFRPAFAGFDQAVKRALEKFLDERSDAYEETDPFLVRATRAMDAAHVVIDRTARNPKSGGARKSLGELDEAIESLQSYTRDHHSELRDRYDMTAGAHNRFVDSLKETYKKASDVQTKAAKKHEFDNELPFLRMQLHMTLQGYNVLLQY